jgi:hypothetical protein
MHQGPIKWWLAFDFADYTILCYLCYLVLLFLADNLFDVGSKLTTKLKLNAHSDDCIFLIGITSHIAYFIIGLSYFYFTGDDFFSGFKIVDSVDVRYDIFRWRVIRCVLIIVISGFLLMPLLCGSIAYRKRRGFWKWCAFGFLFGYLALGKLLTLKPVPSLVHSKEAQ